MRLIGIYNLVINIAAGCEGCKKNWAAFLYDLTKEYNELKKSIE